MDAKDKCETCNRKFKKVKEGDDKKEKKPRVNYKRIISELKALNNNIVNAILNDNL